MRQGAEKKMADEVHFRKGAVVEVSSDEAGFSGAWYKATVCRCYPKKGRVSVQYDRLITESDESKPLTEVVDLSHVRPCPPVVDGDVADIELGDEVDAFYNDGWWIGNIKEFVGESGCVVYFSRSNEEIVFDMPELRRHRDWIDGKWVVSECNSLARSKEPWNGDEEKSPLSAFVSKGKRTVRARRQIKFDSSRSSKKLKKGQVVQERLCTAACQVVTTSIKTLIDMEMEYDNVSPSIIVEWGGNYNRSAMVDNQASFKSPPLGKGGTSNPHMLQEIMFNYSLLGQERSMQNGIVDDRVELSKTDRVSSCSEFKGFQDPSSLEGAIVLSGAIDLTEDGQCGGADSPTDEQPLKNYVSQLKYQKRNTFQGTAVRRSRVKQRRERKGKLESKRGRQKAAIRKTKSQTGGDFPVDINPKGAGVKEQLCNDSVGKKSNGNQANMQIIEQIAQGSPQDENCKVQEPLDMTMSSSINLLGGCAPLSNQINGLRSKELDAIHLQPLRGQDDPSKGVILDKLVLKNMRTPFVKSSPLWEVVESMEAFRKMPQYPHFFFLQQYCEEYREGLALGFMLAFANLVGSTCKSQVDDPPGLLQSRLKALIELEKHGFDVQLLRARIQEMLSLKNRQEQFEKKATVMEGQILNLKHEKDRLCSEINQMNSDILWLEQSLSVLQKRRALVIKQKENNNSEIFKLQEELHVIREGHRNIKHDYQAVARAPW